MNPSRRPEAPAAETATAASPGAVTESPPHRQTLTSTPAHSQMVSRSPRSTNTRQVMVVKPRRNVGVSRCRDLPSPALSPSEDEKLPDLQLALDRVMGRSVCKMDVIRWARRLAVVAGTAAAVTTPEPAQTDLPRLIQSDVEVPSPAGAMKNELRLCCALVVTVYDC